MVEDGQLVCKLTFERMIEAPTRLYGQGVGSNYQRQTETLGKHFFVEGEDRGKRRKGARKVARDAPPEDALELSLEDG
jgi:hypothetical protein